jgi:hypothetical protein
MMRSTDSELAANRRCSFGTTGEVRLFRGFTCSRFAYLAGNPAIGGIGHMSNGACAHLPRPHAPGGSHFPRGTNHSKPIARTFVERFSPTRL